ncbi:hypothetical protein H3N35_23500 [Thalassomonas haliotis]|uniref:Uncharacterized protein n=1 Tax=Thalassomonas haliotis TaxID=485448 RepID=A0ABY7VPB6_9GAMM|nr:hypothetical protein H3N35_23500 [Thalassomonas haliotis]
MKAYHLATLVITAGGILLCWGSL